MPGGDRHCKTSIPMLLDGQLQGAEQDRVTIHLLACRECRREFALVQWMRRFSRVYFSSSMPPELEKRIVRSIAAQRREEHRRARGGSVPLPVLLAVCAVAAALVVVALLF